MANKQNVERIGVETVVESLNKFTRDMTQYTKQLDTGAKATTDFAKTSDKAAKSGKGFTSFLSDVGKQISKSVPGVSSLSGAITGLINPAALAAAAIAGLSTGIFSLGLQGAKVIGIGTAFENIIAPILEAGQTTDDFLANLRRGAGDTISELELMRLTNVALAGSTGELRETFGQALPKLLEVARVQAAATGQSVDFLFQSLVTGLKRSSPLLIDNTGLTLSVADANKAYADTLGITVDQMTEQQKQIALINATLEAGQQAIDAAGGITETAADKFARSGALIQNIMNKLAVAFEPFVGKVLDVVNSVLSSIESSVDAFIPYIEATLQSFGNLLVNIGRFLQPPVRFIIDIIGGILTFIGDAIPPFVEGAVNIAAAIGNGLLAGANTFIFPAVISIATFIADFLSGFSPPPRGPLSTIDKGAANIAEAWTEGFVGGFAITPIEQVAGEVNMALGNIGRLSAKQVASRLAQLDLALRPFQERVKLLEDSFNALKEFTDAGLSAIDAEVNRLLPALAAGDQQAAERIRQLQQQRSEIEGITYAREQQLNQAKIDLAVARARQQQERTLLEIQQGRVGVYKEEAKAVSEVAKETDKAQTKAGVKPKTGGAGGVTPVAEPTIAGLPEQQIDKSGLAKDTGVSFFGLNFGALADQFAAGLNAGGELEEFQGNVDTLQEQFARIGESDPVQGILGAFSGFGSQMETLVKDAVGWFTDPEKDGLAGFINDINTRGAGEVFGDIASGITTWLTAQFAEPFATIADLALSVFRSPDDPDSLYSYFLNFQSNIETQWGNVSEILGTWITDNIITPFTEQIGILTSGPDVEGSIANFMVRIPDLISEAVGNTADLAVDIFFGLQAWAKGDTEDGGLPALIQRLISPFNAIPEGIWNALRNIGLIAWNVMVVPFIEAANEIIDRINEFFNVVNNSELTAFARNVLDLDIPEISFDRISTLPPAWLQPSRGGIGNSGGGMNQSAAGATESFAATGGLFTGGAINVGERGMETMMSAQPFAVFSNQFMKAMQIFSGAVQQFTGGYAVAGNPMAYGNQSIDNSITVNANTSQGYNSADMANRVSMARMFSR